MFEGILEKLLKQYLGQFVDGIDYNNLKLGVWSGQIVIKNVSIKPDVLNNLELPIKIKYSKIGCLTLNVPWSAISTQPVELQLENIVLILSPKAREQWEFFDHKSFKTKIDQLEAFSAQYLQQLLQLQTQQEGAKQDPTQAGYVEKLTIKIIDNIQIKITNIHVRIENEIVKNPYSFGISLNSLDVFTTNNKWEKNFIDRTQQEHKDKPMFKLLRLKDLGVYWTSRDKQLFGNLMDKDNTYKNMTSMILSDQSNNDLNYIFRISAEARLIQHQKGQYIDPEFNVSINLQQIGFHLQKNQMQEIIQLMEFFAQFQDILAQQSKINTKITDNQLEEFKNIFMKNYLEIKSSESKDYKTVLDQNSLQIFEKLIISVEIEKIIEWSKSVLKEVSKLEAKKKIEQDKIKASKGWFWNSKIDNEQLVSKEEQDKLDNFFTNFKEEAGAIINVIRPKEYIWLKLNLTVSSSILKVSQYNKENNSDDGVMLRLENINVNVDLRDTNKQLSFLLDDLLIDLYSKSLDFNNENLTPFLLKQKTTKEKFIAINVDLNPLKQGQNEIPIDTFLQAKFQSLLCIYNPLLVSRLGEIFKLQTDDELKNKAWDAIDKNIDKGQEKLNSAIESQSITKLDIWIISPLIILPFNDPQNQCWTFNLGDLQIKTDSSVIDSRIDAKTKLFDIHNISLSQINMKYHPNQLKLGQNDFSLIENFSIGLQIKVLRLINSTIVKENESLIVNGELPQLSIKLNREIYEKILLIGDCFGEVQDTFQEEQVSKQEMLKSPKTKKMGVIYYKQKGFWAHKTALLSGSYIYLYANSKDQMYESFVYIRNSFVKNDVKDEFYDNTIIVSNKYQTFYMGFEKPNDMKSWTKLIQDQNFLKQKENAVEIQPKNKEDIDHQKINLKVNFLIKDVQLSLQNENHKKWLLFETQQKLYLSFIIKNFINI